MTEQQAIRFLMWLGLMAVLVSVMLLSACAPNEVRELVAEKFDLPAMPVPTLIRSAFLPEFAESSPIEFQGAISVLSFERTSRDALVVRDLAGAELSADPWTRSLGCAFVEGTRAYVFSSDSTRVEIAMRYSDDLLTWSADTAVSGLEGSEFKTLWNCSVIKDSTGYLMLYEVSEPGIRSFSFRAARSTDLLNWIPTGRLFSHEYSACPAVRLIDGEYYVTYLEEFSGGLRTRVARTLDFTRYEIAGAPLLEAESGEGTNASDVDLVEFNGETILTYITGDQTTWGETKLARYSGTMKQLFLSMFPN